MTQPIDRPGHFRGTITEYGIREEQSGAIAVGVKIALSAMWNPELVIDDVKGNWEPWDQYDMEAEGFIYVINKKSEMMPKNIESLVKFAGWDSTFESIDQKTWVPTACGVTVTEEEYKERKSLRASFINSFDWTPGARSNVGSDRVRELSSRFGGPLRAVAANAKRGQAAPGGKPTPPPPANGSAHNPPPATAWTFEQAVKAVTEAGYSRQQLVEVVQANGRSGWNMMLDTPLAKALIAGGMVPAGSGADVPF